MATDRAALLHEVLRVHGRYASEVVEALNFCPFSAAARAGGRVQLRVLFGREPDSAVAARELESLEYDESIEIALLIYPEVVLSRVEFQHFAAEVRAADEQRAGRGRTAFALADFHPDAEPELGSAEQLVAFIRRSPDPLLQLVRRSALDAVRGEVQGTRFVDPAQLLEAAVLTTTTTPEPLHQRIARANHRTVQRLGVETVAALLEDILSDRDRSYARFGLEPPPWRPRLGTSSV